MPTKNKRLIGWAIMCRNCKHSSGNVNTRKCSHPARLTVKASSVHCPIWEDLEKAPVSRVVPPDPKRGEVGPQIVTDLFEGKEPENDQKDD